MSGEYRSYVVRQGDYLARLAHLHGFDAEEVWNHPKNEALRALRRDPEVLAPGDVIYLPRKAQAGLPFAAEGVNRYRATVPRVPLRLRFKDGAGPLANEAWVIEGSASPAEGTTDAEGQLEVVTSPHVASFTVRFPARERAFTVRVGHLDPLEEESGVRARLTQLGYLPPPLGPLFGIDEPGALGTLSGEGDRLRAAIRDFQRAEGLEVTGMVDDATREVLWKAHGA
jgi:N-acetylmuramoyl-L-alanine amidase